MPRYRLLCLGACAALATSGLPLLAATQVSAAASSATDATNTRINQRDRSMQTTTPFDQPNNRTDIDLAAAVRKAIVADDALSTQAHNIKLVAANGLVTLRGPVASADEKAKVAADASGVPGVTRVDNQLDIQN